MRLFFVSKDRGEVLRATPVDRISPNTMDAAIAMTRLDPTQYNHDSFLRRFSFLVTGLEEEWQGLTLNIHRGNAIVTHLESRLPSHSTIAGALHDDEAAEHGRYRTLVDCGSS